MTLDQLKAALAKYLAANPALAAAVDQFGPTLLAMGEADLQAFVSALINGQTEAAWELLYGQLSDEDLLAAMNAWLVAVHGANVHVADEINAARSFFQQVANALLIVAWTAAGF
jgi:hypothetical protein